MATTKPKKKKRGRLRYGPRLKYGRLWASTADRFGGGLKGSAPIISDAAFAPYSGLWPCQIEASKGPRYGKPSDTQPRDNLVVLVGCKAPGHQGLGAGISFQGRPPLASGHFWASESQLKPTGVKTNAAWVLTVSTATRRPADAGAKVRQVDDASGARRSAGLGMGPSYVYASYRRNYCTSDNTRSLTNSVTNGRDKRHAGRAAGYNLRLATKLRLKTGLSEQPGSALDTPARGGLGF
ncbi:hypothetical protein EDB80DRAFT_676120 [Ilyonectria destructans]|nr:hypothetical protein EDB80DRAFT_676120 [Ilyonectria destructans]